MEEKDRKYILLYGQKGTTKKEPLKGIR